jgi:hypothetical protein
MYIWIGAFVYFENTLCVAIVISFQHELGIAADEGVRQLVEQTDGDVCDADKTTAMKVAATKKAEALHKKMSKLVCVANPELTDGWLREVCPLL